MLKKLQIKFVCINMIIVTGMLCVIFGMIYTFTKSNLETESIRMMQTLAEAPFNPGQHERLPEQMRLPHFTLQVGPRGDLVAYGDSYYDLSDEEFLHAVLDASFASGEKTGVLKSYGLRFCRVVTPQKQCIVFADISSERTTLNNLLRTCAIIGISSFILFFGISLLLARWAIKPVAKAWAQQKQFVADASHELKTPLTVILTNAELLQDPAYGETAKAQFSENVLTMSNQMRGLVESLLELARVDNGTAKMSFLPLDLSLLVSDSTLPFEPLYFEKELTLQCQLEPNLQVKGSEAHLRQVVEILLDNAMKYSAPQGTVYISLRKHGSHALLSVSNPGEPIAPEDLKNIFKRFYRADKARSMNHSYGLGLSIAESILHEHHGKIWAESVNGYNIFHVQLPL